MYLVAIGEIFLKGKNRVIFERRLIRNIRKTLNLEENELLKWVWVDAPSKINEKINNTLVQELTKLIE